MLTYNLLDSDQLAAVDYLYSHDVNYLVATMGFGKSVVTLTAIDELINDEVLARVLIVAPLRACNDVWKGEHKKWEHLQGIDIVHAIGTPKQRVAALESDASIVVINIDNLVWFLDTYKDKNLLGFDGLVIDEISKFKDSGTKLVKKLRTLTKRFAWTLGMTGTPVHESFTGLYAQMLCLDGGQSFGKNKEKFLHKFFYPTDFDERNWELRDNMEGEILKAIGWCTHVAPDYTHTLPPINEVVLGFDLPDEALREYKKFARDSVIAIEDEMVIAENAAVLSGKLGQYASGFLYLEDEGDFIDIHLARVHEFTSLLRNIPRAVICYWYKAELTAILECFDASGVSYAMVNDKGAIEAWNNKTIDYLLLHPASAGHGLNLAAGGCNMIFYSPIWSNDIFKQTIARLWRRGQDAVVTAWILCATGTIDMLKIQRVEDKAEYDKLFHDHIDKL